MASIYDIRTLIRANFDELQSFGNISAEAINSGKRGRPTTACHINRQQAFAHRCDDGREGLGELYSD